jgi:hypothetical protein
MIFDAPRRITAQNILFTVVGLAILAFGFYWLIVKLLPKSNFTALPSVNPAKNKGRLGRRPLE